LQVPDVVIPADANGGVELTVARYDAFGASRTFRP
jgi:hypothetical protein